MEGVGNGLNDEIVIEDGCVSIVGDGCDGVDEFL